ncbi:MAG: hypothetical protein AAGD07_06415 [Planctomycetota bacterium]
MARTQPDRPFSDAELLAFLDESLGARRSAEIETAVRDDPALQNRMVQLRGQSIAGLHTIGSIWRRHHLSCPSRETLMAYTKGTLEMQHAQYIDFHLRDVGCRFCQANLEDIAEQTHATGESQNRRRRLFQTSAGHLRKDP